MDKMTNKEAVDALLDMHRGLHIGMDSLINNQDIKKTEQILRELDFHMSNWINQTKVLR